MKDTSKENQLLERNREIMNQFNKPYQTVVAIDCTYIGDDNDYSCFLSNVISELWKAGKQEMALTLANTDPMKIANWTMENMREYQTQKIDKAA